MRQFIFGTQRSSNVSSMVESSKPIKSLDLEATSELESSSSDAQFSGARLNASSIRKPPPNYYSRSEQYRLLILCSTLMLVLVAMNEVRKPEMWEWMWGPSSPTSELALDSAKVIDTRADYDQAIKGLPADGFRVTRASTISEAAGRGKGVSYLPGVTPKLLAPIQDNSILRVAENDAWQTILGILKATPQSVLQSQTMGDVSFAQLFRQTNVYRGRLVSIRGTVHRAERIVPRDNENGIAELFRWIVEPAGPSNAPIVIYSIEKPKEFQLGDDLREEATFTGVCFKRWAYAAGDGTRIAPLLLAKTPDWHPSPPPTPATLPPLPTVVATLAALGALAIGIALVVYRSTIATRPEVARMREPLSRRVDQLNESQILPPIGESLREMAAQAKRDETQHDSRE